MPETQQTAWRPDNETIRNANVTAVMRDVGVDTYPGLHRWSIEDRPAFWQLVLNRLGDHMDRLPNGHYRALGRVDDTMNLGGVKISSAELERVVGTIDGVVEVAAVAVSPLGGGPSRLVVYAVPAPGIVVDPDSWRSEMQHAISTELDPLFKIHEVVLVDALPRTASAKVTPRELRARYE